MTAAEVIALLDGRWGSNAWSFSRSCKKLSPDVIREVLVAFGEAAADPQCNFRDIAIFVGDVMSGAPPDEDVTLHWKAAVQAVGDLNTSYGWGSKQKKQKFNGLAAKPEVVRALQAVAVGCAFPSLDILAVLTADGSDASIDALMPHVDRAEKDGRRLKQLTRLRVHANPNSPAMAKLLDAVDASLDNLSEVSPARSLASRIGLGDPDPFWFQASVSSSVLNDSNVPLYQGQIEVDSRRPGWFRVWMTHVSLQDFRTTFFGVEEDERDELKLGTCTGQELSAWLSRAAETLQVTWSVHLRSSVRGQKRQLIVDWLVPPPA